MNIIKKYILIPLLCHSVGYPVLEQTVSNPVLLAILQFYY